MVTSTLRALTLVGATLAAGGSATVIKGTGQPVSITTNPPGATVYVDQRPVGVSPLVVELPHDEATVSAVAPGYQPGYAVLTTSFSGWTLLNAFILVVPMVVDVATGAITTLDQDNVIIHLVPGSGEGMPQPGYQRPPSPTPQGAPERR